MLSVVAASDMFAAFLTGKGNRAEIRKVLFLLLSADGPVTTITGWQLHKGKVSCCNADRLFLGFVNSAKEAEEVFNVKVEKIDNGKNSDQH